MIKIKRRSNFSLLIFLLIIILSGCKQGKKEVVRFGGGPTGGTFHRIALGMASVINDFNDNYRVQTIRSGGSVGNLSELSRGKLEMGLVYAGDLGLLKEGEKTAEDSQLRVLARLYGAAAHLVTRRDSPVRVPSDLHGKRVAIGNPGSGAALSAERFFKAMNLWDKIIPVHIGYSMALQDLRRGGVDAGWQLVGLPSASIYETGETFPLRYIDLFESGQEYIFLKKYPSYSASVIPAGTYPDQDKDIRTFEDAALWVVRSDLSRKTVTNFLTTLFSDAGSIKMKKVHPVAKEITPENGAKLEGFALHPGAQIFWNKEKEESISK